MPRRHQHTYRRPKPAFESLFDLEREITPEPEPVHERQRHASEPIDYRPIVVVIGIVIFGLAVIGFLLLLRAQP